MKAAYSACEIADLRLPAMPTTPQGVNRFLASTPEHLLKRRSRKLGGRLYLVSALPEAAQRELARRESAKLAAASREIGACQKPTNDTAHLTARQREAMTARVAICAEIERMAIVSGRGRTAAVDEFLADFAARRLPAEIDMMVTIANAKGGSVSRRTLFRWLAAAREGKAAMAPQPTRTKAPTPTWFDSFFPWYARPTKPDIAAAYRDWEKACGGEAPASYAAVRRTVRALKTLDHVAMAHGREGALALKARQAYVTRDFSDLAPSTIYVADGTTFDAEVAHPIHGRPFKPELTVIVDVATRRRVGWSAGLSESRWAVADALRRAVAQGIPALFYSDNGPGYRNAAMLDELTGLLTRLGTTAMRARPYNAQAKGAVERVQKEWIALARKFPTFTGTGMDREAKQKAFQRTRRDIALVGVSPLLPTWEQFCATVEEAIAAHNARPHRSLPRVRDSRTGAWRHLSPDEFWKRKLKAGAELIVPDAAEMADLFRPYDVRRVRRCMLTLGTNSYFATALDAFHEQDVMVGYDVRDASQVWARRIDLVDGERRPGALICVARFEGNKTRYVPISVEQASMERRAEGRRRRLNDKLSVVEAELSPSKLLTLRPVEPFVIPDPSPAPVPVGVVSADGPSTSPQAPQAMTSDGPSAEGGRRALRTDAEWAEWILKHPSEATETDRELCVELLASEASRRLLQRSGVDLERLSALLLDDAA